MGGQSLSTGAARHFASQHILYSLCSKIISVEYKDRKSYESWVAVKYSLTFFALKTKEAPFFMKVRGRLTIKSRDGRIL